MDCLSLDGICWEGVGMKTKIPKLFYTVGLPGGGKSTWLESNKEKLHIKYYVRYMDDMILIHEDKEYLKYCWKEIEKELGLPVLAVTPYINFNELDEKGNLIKKRK